MKTLKTLNKDLILCADDFAQNEAICEGIVLLLENNRINAVSVLVNTPLWPSVHTTLKPFETNSHLGLHLNLTHGKPLSSLWRKHYGNRFQDLTTVLRNSYMGSYTKPVLVAEIMAQITAFSEAMGKHPDFIDGHQHIHQLPGVRDVLLELHDRYQWTNFFRNTSNGLCDLFSPNAFPKRQLIALLGGNTFKKQLVRAKIATNTSFAGIYSFKHAANYRKYFKQFLTMSAPSGLIMCHPGMPSHDLRDPLRQARPNELAYFMSADFLDDLKSPLQKAR
jgi:predicted glycoside hydrolase/deacetylase ChbG (UPF0249 family)